MAAPSSQRGQASLELALVLPLLVMVLFGIVEVGRLLHAELLLQHAAREAARLGITGASDTEVEAVARTLTASLDQELLQVAVSPAAADRHRGELLQVALAYTFRVVYPLLPGWPAPVPLRAAVVMRVE